MITIINYGAGNLQSVVNAITKLGYEATVTSNPQNIPDAQAVILPGVGAASATMTSLQKLGLIEPIRRFIIDGRPFLGICIGLQVLLSSTEEGGWYECMGIIPGVVRRLPSGQKIPHMGWNQVKQRGTHPVFSGIPDKANFYFVHSYYVEPEDSAIVAGETEYGLTFCSAIAKDNLVATQFHPERSGNIGLKFCDNFIKMALESEVS